MRPKAKLTRCPLCGTWSYRRPCGICRNTPDWAERAKLAAVIEAERQAQAAAAELAEWLAQEVHS